MRIKPRPALYFLIPYLLGIIAGRWISVPFLWLWISVLCCLIGSLVTRNRQRYLCYGLLHLAIFAGGMLRLETVSHSPIPAHFYDEPVSFSGTTLYQPERGEAWDACYAVGELQLLSDPAQRVSSKFLIRFQELLPLRYGTDLTLTGVLHQPQAKRNPGGFDYQAYLARQGIGGIIDVKGLLRIGEQGGFAPLRWIEALRHRTERIINVIYTAPTAETHPSEPSLHAQLIKGILLGKRSDVPSETLDIFRNSGTFHVLAVSGLHVGLVAMFCYLGFSLFRFPQKMLCLLTIIAVLIYACLIGFRPSVFRASLMAILFLVAILIDRDADLYNLLAFAALVLLLLNPQQVWDVGFQLSFVAVASIVYFVPKMENPLRRLWTGAEDPPSDSEGSVLTRFRNTTIKWLVLSYLVTLAAQIGNGPLNRLPFLSGISARYHRRSVCGWTRIAYRCGRDGIRLRRFLMASTRAAARTSQPRCYLHLSDTDRHIWTDMGHRKTNTAHVRFFRPLSRLLFRHHTLAICLSSMESRKPHRTIGHDDLGLECRFSRERKDCWK